jgi:hypothetical protein
VQADGYELTELECDGDRHALHLRRLEGGERRLLVLGEGRERVVAALRVIDGARPALPAGESKLLRQPREGSFIYAAATKLDGLPEIEPASELLRLSDGFAADVGEAGGELSAELTISAGPERDAADMAAVVEGVVAIGRLAAAREPGPCPVRDLAEGVRVRVEERRLSLRVQMVAEKLIEALRECALGDDDGDGDEDDEGDDHGDDGHPD